MTAIPWYVLSDSQSSQWLCNGDCWPENDFLSSLQPPSSAWKTILGYICIHSSLEALLQLYPWCSKPCTSLERSYVSWNWLTTSQRSRKPPVSAETLASQDCLIYIWALSFLWLTLCFALPGVVYYTFYRYLNIFFFHNVLIWTRRQIYLACRGPFQWMAMFILSFPTTSPTISKPLW